MYDMRCQCERVCARLRQLHAVLASALLLDCSMCEGRALGLRLGRGMFVGPSLCLGQTQGGFVASIVFVAIEVQYGLARAGERPFRANLCQLAEDALVECCMKAELTVQEETAVAPYPQSPRPTLSCRESPCCSLCEMLEGKS